MRTQVVGDSRAGWSIVAYLPLIGWGRSAFYELPPEKQPHSIKIGRRRVIVEPPADYLARLAKEGGAVPVKKKREPGGPVTPHTFERADEPVLHGFITKRTACYVAGVSPATLLRKVAAGTFPKPVISDGNFARWDSQAVARWRAERLANPQIMLEDRQKERAWRASRQNKPATRTPASLG